MLHRLQFLLVYEYQIIWKQENMREIGAILGLTLGYIIKYNLDKRYVFKEQ